MEIPSMLGYITDTAIIILYNITAEILHRTSNKLCMRTLCFVNILGSLTLLFMPFM
jgi:hypothetical protein